MMKAFSRQLITVVSAAFTAGVLLMLAFDTDLYYDRSSMGFQAAMFNGSDAFSAPHRKHLHREMVEPKRVGGERCSKKDIVISQGPTPPLPSGIPTYLVEIVNACVTGCYISDIHLSCGWFSSARLVNPNVFKRLNYDDCLVNAGQPLTCGRTLSFQYANTFPYDLAVSSLVC